MTEAVSVVVSWEGSYMCSFSVFMCYNDESVFLSRGIKCRAVTHTILNMNLRGGFSRGGASQGPTRADFRNGPSNTSDPQVTESDDKDNVSTPSKSDRWSHDGFDQMMKVNDKRYRNQRSNSRPRTVHGKVCYCEIV